MAAGRPQLHEQAHPGPRKYVVIGAALAVITLVEVGIFYLPFTPALLAALILFTSMVKFSVVVGYFMHLRFDDRRFLALFAFGFFIALSIMIVLMALSSNLTR